MVPACLAAMTEAVPRAPRSSRSGRKPGRAAKLVLLRGVRQARTPMRLMPGLVLHQPDGSFTGQLRRFCGTGRRVGIGAVVFGLCLCHDARRGGAKSRPRSDAAVPKALMRGDEAFHVAPPGAVRRQRAAASASFPGCEATLPRPRNPPGRMRDGRRSGSCPTGAGCSAAPPPVPVSRPASSSVWLTVAPNMMVVPIEASTGAKRTVSGRYHCSALPIRSDIDHGIRSCTMKQPAS